MEKTLCNTTEHMLTKIEIDTIDVGQSIWGEIFNNEPAKFVKDSLQRFQTIESVSHRFEKLKKRVQNI